MKREEILKKLESDESDTDYVFRSEQEDKTFLENHAKSVIEKELDPKVAEIHSQYDDDMFKLFGKRKKPGEKTYNFLKEQFEQLKSRADKVESLENEIIELKKEAPDDASRLKEIKDLQSQIARLKQDQDEEISRLVKQNLKNNIKNEIERGLLNLKLKDGIPEKMKKIYVDTIINELSDNAEMREEGIVFLDKEGKALRDERTMAPYTAEALLRERMKDIIDEGRIVTGPGIKVDKIEKDKDGKPIIIRPPTVTSREKLGEYLVKELGLKRNSEDYMTAYAEYGKDLPAVEPKN